MFLRFTEGNTSQVLFAAIVISRFCFHAFAGNCDSFFLHQLDSANLTILVRIGDL